MKVLKEIKPENVFGFFEEISRIPRGSGNTKKISAFVKDFAVKRGLEHYTDELGNVIIMKAATEGYEDSEPIILQGHLDMVCNKTEDCDKDMVNEPIDIAVDGDLVYAKKTTLGGDDGIAVAYMMAILDSDTLKHPKVEAVFTVDEETGLYGAEAIDVSVLEGRRFINLDSEDEGILTVGCAGGITAIANLPLNREKMDGQALKISLAGFTGGHSGTDIILGQENAIRVMGRVLSALRTQADAGIVEINGGYADNVIPEHASAVVKVADVEKAEEILSELEKTFRHEFKKDPDFTMTAEKTETELDVLDSKSAESATALIFAAPNGIIKMTPDVEGLPQTSLNLGVARMNKSEFGCIFALRSSVDSETMMLADSLCCFIRAIGGEAKTEGFYPGWEYNAKSELSKLVNEVYNEQTGRDMVVEAIHAGLECGYFAEKIEGLDCVSIGPDLNDVHTTNETMSISSVRRTWNLLVEVLERLK